MHNKDLLNIMSIEHDYYCHTENYYGGGSSEWKNIREFLDEFEDCEICYNLIFRWDVNIEENTIYIFMIQQRKGNFHPHVITNIDEKNLHLLYNFLQKHFDYILDLWVPFDCFTRSDGNRYKMVKCE